MEENNNEFETNQKLKQANEMSKKKLKTISILIAIIMISILVLTLSIANRYAVTNEYKNVFEMIVSKISGTEKIDVQGNADKKTETDSAEDYAVENKIEKVYAIENNQNTAMGYFWTFEYDDSNENYAEIYYLLTNYSTEPSIEYTLKIKDEKNNSLILGEKEKIIGGKLSSVKIQKVSLDSKINISVYENDEEKIKMQIDLKDDLEPKEKLDEPSSWRNSQLGDLKFSYLESGAGDFYSTTKTHAYSEKLVGEYCSFPFGIQYGHSIPEAENVELTYYKNVNNLNLEEAFENLALINECFGAYGLSDVYGLYKTETELVIISYEEMMNLCNGLTIEKDGVEYTKESFRKTYNGSIIKDENVEIDYGIKALKYHYEYEVGEDIEKYNYMFIHNDNIYDIRIPTNDRINEEIQQFLDSLEIN